MSEDRLRTMQQLVRQLFDILDTVEISEDGTEIKPTRIASCRTRHVQRLGELMPRLRELAQDNV